jgi:hypothetical protein
VKEFSVVFSMSPAALQFMDPLETNSHQDHVIAHVLGTTILGSFTWDETLYLLLDIGFVWNIYLDFEMGPFAAPGCDCRDGDRRGNQDRTTKRY